MVSFDILASQRFARAGLLRTSHGIVPTPVFMAVGTQASVKSLDSKDVKSLGSPIILGNTYHLYLRPGHERIRRLGGLHKFMRWDKPILTDSGGYQVSSLGLFKVDGSERLSRVDDDGVTFQSHIDGSEHRFTPELAIQIQEALGSDIMMAFDEATPEMGRGYAEEAMERTHRWLDRCVLEWKKLNSKRSSMGQYPQALFGIIQGGNFEDLRKKSAKYIVRHDVSGIAIGGATIGQSPEETEKNIAYVRGIIPDHKPLYAMGVGVGPDHVLEVIKSGADMFDCVAPTKLARCGLIYDAPLVIPDDDIYKAYFSSNLNHLRYSIGKAIYAEDERPLMSNCHCYTCRSGYTRAYLHHLFKARELSFYRLASIHNVYVMVATARKLREAILRKAGVVVDGVSQ